MLCLLGLCFISVLFSCSVLHSHTALANLPNEPQELHNNNNNNSYYTSTANRKHIGDEHTHKQVHQWFHLDSYGQTQVDHKEEGITAKGIKYPKLYDEA